MKGESSRDTKRVIHYDAADDVPLDPKARLALESARELQNINAQLVLKLNELLGSQQQLVQAEKMALASKLSGAFAHEVNNPLSVLCSSLELLKDTLSGLEKLWSETSILGSSQQLRLGQESKASLQESRELINDAILSAQRLGDLVASLTRVAHPAWTATRGRADLGKATRDVFSAGELEGGGAAPLSSNVGAADSGPNVYWVACDGEELEKNLRRLATCFKTPAGLDLSGIEARISESRDGPTLVLTNREIVLTDAQRRSLFEPRLEKDETGQTIRLNLTLAETYLWLRDVGAEIIQEGEPGLVIRVLFPPVQSAG